MNPALLWKIPSKAMSHLEGPCISGMQGPIIATATANEFLIFTYRLVVLCICTKICENISKGFRVIDGWIDDLQFYVLFNSISVIYGQCSDDNERLCALEL